MKKYVLARCDCRQYEQFKANVSVLAYFENWSLAEEIREREALADDESGIYYVVFTIES